MAADLQAELPLRVEAEGVRPPSDQHTRLHTPVLGAIEQAGLRQAVVTQDVAIVLPVHDGQPGLELHLHVAVEHEGAAERNLVPAARGLAILPIRFVLEHEDGVADVFVVIHDEVPQADAGVEVQVAHGERLLGHVPDRLLGELQEEVGVKRQAALGQAVADADLELYIAVIPTDALANGDAADEVIVAEDAEVGAALDHGAHAVGVVVRARSLKALE